MANREVTEQDRETIAPHPFPACEAAGTELFRIEIYNSSDQYGEGVSSSATHAPTNGLGKNRCRPDVGACARSAGGIVHVYPEFPQRCNE